MFQYFLKVVSTQFRTLDGKIVKAESLFDTAQGERIWGTRTPAA